MIDAGDKKSEVGNQHTYSKYLPIFKKLPDK